MKQFFVPFISKTFFCIFASLIFQSCNQSYKPNDPTTALPPSGWENSLIVTSATCNTKQNFFTFTLASQFPLIIGFTNNQIQINLNCFNFDACQITDPSNPLCQGTVWNNAPNSTLSCFINNNLNGSCTTSGCSVNSGSTQFSCLSPNIQDACANGVIGKRVCQISGMVIGIDNFPQSISYNFQFMGPQF